VLYWGTVNGNSKKPKKIEVKKILLITPRKILRGVIILLLAVYFVFGLASFFTPPSGGEIPLSEALTKIQNREVKQVEVFDNKIDLKLNNDQTVSAQKEPGVSFTEILKNSGIDPSSIDFRINNQSWTKVVGDILATLLPLGLTAILFWYIFKQAGRAQNSIFSFGKSPARLFVSKKQNITFNDVAGLKEAKEELKEVVDFLKHPEKYRKIGARTPKGVLLVGPSGVGKTLLAKAVAGEANVPFFSMAGSEFMEMLVGVGASRVRDLFANAKKAAPSIIFVDEIDAIGRMRGLGMSAGHDEREQTLNQILVEMDGFEPADRVVVIAATNRGDLLDPALLRPGRFDRRVVLMMPDIEEREEILRLHSRGKPFRGVSWKQIARQTVGFSGADLENMVNEAAILAARREKQVIGKSEIEEAEIKVKLGPEKRRVQTEKDKTLTAYHEAGHAIVSWILPDMDPLQRVSIISRGLALGYTMISPKRERFHETKSFLQAHVTTLLGGRAAEEIKFKEMTTGAASDIQQATQIARKMVVEYGMSILGPVNLGPQMDTDDWARAYMPPSDISPQMQAKVDVEVKKIIDRGYEEAVKILRRKAKTLDLIARQLVIKETLDKKDFEKLISR